MMANMVVNVPDELLIQICEGVHKNDLKALRLVSRKLNTVASERLFRRLKTTFPKHGDGAVARFTGLSNSITARNIKVIDLRPIIYRADIEFAGRQVRQK
jgi:hypothetical protein